MALRSPSDLAASHYVNRRQFAKLEQLAQDSGRPHDLNDP
jgi:hypothetical protein